jgi:hypothetical protein
MASNLNATPDVRDPEFDAPRAAVRRPRGPVLMPQETQRLLANPFLGVSLLIFGIVLFASGYEGRSPALLGIALLLALSSVVFLHYHCLDCGATGFLFRWRRHECEHVLLRRLAGSVRRWRGPTPVLQTILWAYALLVVAILAVILVFALD